MTLSTKRLHHSCLGFNLPRVSIASHQDIRNEKLATNDPEFKTLGQMYHEPMVFRLSAGGSADKDMNQLATATDTLG